MRKKDPTNIASYLNPSRRPKGPRKPKKGGEPQHEPVEPPRPNTLSGGAAAELEFDD